MKRKPIITLLFAVALVLAAGQASAECKLEVDGGADLVSRYVWRGADFGDSPALQPWLNFNLGGLDAGFWASYATSNNLWLDDPFAEIDAYVSYTYQVPNSVSLTGVVTDYYFPSDGPDYFNYDNYDNEDGPGAHVVELGFGITGPESLPLSFFGFVNVHNDEGNNMYFELGYATTVKETDLEFFIGATPGSEDTPGYYGTDDLEVINLGVMASKEVKITEHYNLPLFVSYTLNPEDEQAYLLFGMSF
jgi:uncharacterized protein (TIGR02001 family)